MWKCKKCGGYEVYSKKIETTYYECDKKGYNEAIIAEGYEFIHVCSDCHSESILRIQDIATWDEESSIEMKKFSLENKKIMDGFKNVEV